MIDTHLICVVTNERIRLVARAKIHLLAGALTTGRKGHTVELAFGSQKLQLGLTILIRKIRENMGQMSPPAHITEKQNELSCLRLRPDQAKLFRFQVCVPIR